MQDKKRCQEMAMWSDMEKDRMVKIDKQLLQRVNALLKAQPVERWSSGHSSKLPNRAAWSGCDQKQDSDCERICPGRDQESEIQERA